MTITAKIVPQRGTAADWQSQNPVLDEGETGFEIDSKRSKIGDGATAWADLPYVDQRISRHYQDAEEAAEITDFAEGQTCTIGNLGGYIFTSDEALVPNGDTVLGVASGGRLVAMRRAMTNAEFTADTRPQGQFETGEVISLTDLRVSMAVVTSGEHRTNTAGAKFQFIAENGRRFTPKMFGYDGSASLAARTAVLQSWASSGLPLYLPAGEWTVNTTILVSSDLNLKGEAGARIIGDASGSYGDSVLHVEGAQTVLPDLAADVSAYDIDIEFASAHGLAVGDLFSIHDPTDRSYSDIRPEYRAGEAARVVNVIDSTTVSIDHPLYAGYAAATVNCYKLTGRKVSISDVEVVAPGDTTTRAVKIDIADRPELHRVHARDAGGVNIIMARCVDGTMRDCSSILYDNGSGSTSFYALSFSACQGMRVIGGTYWAHRHAITTSSTEVGDGGFVNRDIIMSGAILSSRAAYSADFHGNTEHSGYIDCTINGGMSLRGNKNFAKGNKIRVSQAQKDLGITACINFDELTGFDSDISDNIIESDADFDASVSKAVICGTQTDTLRAATLGGTMSIINNIIRAPNAKRMIRFTNKGSTATDLRLVIDGNNFGSATQSQTTIKSQVDSGSNFAFAQVTNHVDPTIGNGYDLSGCARVKVDPQYATVAVALPSGSSQITAAVTWPREFVRAPKCVANISDPRDQNVVGATGISYGVVAVTTVGATVRLATSDGSNFASTETRIVTVFAMLDE